VASAPPSSEQPAIDSGRRRVLVAEDDADFREILAQLLRGHGLAVITARDGAEAIEALQGDRRPDLVLLDLAMPVADGWTVLTARNRDPVLREIPVIVTSAQWGVQQRVAAEHAHFLRKPVDCSHVLSMVDVLLAQLSTATT
jgi:CheY-like chemotaxis protein